MTQAGRPRATQQPHPVARGSAGRDGSGHLGAAARSAPASGHGAEAPAEPPGPGAPPAGPAAAAGSVAEEGEQQQHRPAPGVVQGPHPAPPAEHRWVRSGESGDPSLPLGSYPFVRLFVFNFVFYLTGLPLSWKGPKGIESYSSVVWLMGGVGSQVGFDDLEGLFQPGSFCESVMLL